jgi:hypothetical protein
MEGSAIMAVRPEFLEGLNITGGDKTQPTPSAAPESIGRVRPEFLEGLIVNGVKIPKTTPTAIWQPTPEPQDQPGLAESLMGKVSSFSKAATKGLEEATLFGFSDEINAAIQSGIDYATGKEQDLSKAYEKNYNIYKQQTEQIKAESPKTFAGGEALGVVAAGPVGAVKGAGRQIAKNVAMGGAYGAGAAEGGLEEKAKGAALGATVGAVVEGGLRGVGKLITPDADTREMIKIFESAGTTPTVGQATNNKLLQGMENVLGRVLGGQGISARAAAKAQKELGATTDRIADSLAKKYTDEMVGGVTRKGFKTFADNFKARSEVLYNRLNQFIPEDKPVTIDNTLGTLSKLTKPIKGAKNVSGLMISNDLKKWYLALSKDAASGNLPFGALQDLRSSVGRKLTSPDLVSALPKAELKQLYAALSQDIEKAAADNNATRAFKRANKFYKSGMSRIDSFLTPLAKKTEDIDIYNSLVTASKKGAQKISAVKKSLGIKQWETFVGSRIKELGLTTPGRQGAEGDVFSSDVFLTNWNRINPEAKKVMFSGSPELAEYGKNLSALAKAADRIKKSREVIANTSGTSGQSASLAQLSALTFGGFVSPTMAAVAASSVAGSAGIEKILTSPKVINYLSKIPPNLSGGEISGFIGRGSAFYSQQGDKTRSELDGLVSILQPNE